MPIVRVTVNLKFPTGSKAGTNTWHIRTVDETPSVGIMNAAMSSLHQYYSSVSTALWTGGYQARWEGTGLTVESEPQSTPLADWWQVDGTGAAASPAAGVGAVVTWRSNLATRSGRGRTFHTPMKDSAFQSDGTINDTTLTALRAAAATLIDDSDSATGWAFGVYSPTDGVLRDITSATVNDRVAYLSSRRS